MDLKKKSHLLKSRAKELGYEIKLTHAQEMLAATEGHKTRHSALLSNKEPSPVLNTQGMEVNTCCQICYRRPRTKAHYPYSGNPQIWLLCDSCTSYPSKFSIEQGAKDVTTKYDLQATYLRDISFKNKDSRVNKAFSFRLINIDGTLGDRYLFVPGLWSGHSEVKVWNLDKNQEANGWWDWSIILLPF